MKTYMILVNGKYMVKINYEGSLGGAEHFILDNFDGITSALAFDESTIATKWFVRDYLSNAEMISVNELENMSKAYREAFVEYAAAKEAVENKDREIEELKQKLAELSAERKELKEKELSKWVTANKASKTLNVNE